MQVEERAARLESLLHSERIRKRNVRAGDAAPDSAYSSSLTTSAFSRRPSRDAAVPSGSFPGFQGLTSLLARHEAQVAEFERWAVARIWPEFHLREFDWYFVEKILLRSKQFFLKKVGISC